MSSNVIRRIMWSVSLVVAIGCIARGPETAAAVSGMVEETSTLSYAFNDSPEHTAIIKMLREIGEDQMLQTADSIGMSKGKDFANVIIKYSRQGEPTEVELYLFKENDAWVAYRELPTLKDHAAIFSTLARRYCLPQYKHLRSASLIDDTWQSKNTQKRIVNIVCSELINNQWQDHRLTFVFEYDGVKGWHITGQIDTKQPSPKSAQNKEASMSPPGPARPKVKTKVIWGNAKAAMDEVLQFTGTAVQLVYIRFGIAGMDFIQFHYRTENEDEGIKTVNWDKGKLSRPQASNLARPCPPIPLEEIDFNLVPEIFEEMSKKVVRGYNINVTLGRRFFSGCKEPVWQGIAQYANKSIIVSYSIDGKQTNIEENSY